tara:strand:+ start:486 stop:683 length:198 start_codon:yes stop_codon:yes gene_type:complete
MWTKIQKVPCLFEGMDKAQRKERIKAIYDKLCAQWKTNGKTDKSTQQDIKSPYYFRIQALHLDTK